MLRETLGHFTILVDKESLHLEVRIRDKSESEIKQDSVSDGAVVLASIPGKPFIASAVGEDDFTEGKGSLSLSVTLSVSLSLCVCLSLYPSLSLYLSFCLSVFLLLPC
jgi:hypothetical protein